MIRTLAKLLSINPFLSLVLVVGYIAFMWHVTASIWSEGHEFAAIAFLLTVSIIAKLKSKYLISELKAIKAEKQAVQ